jgi:hypothetical protein
LLLGSNRYQIVILPNVETIRPETYRRFEEFVRGGGTLIATGQAPSKAPGLKAAESDHGFIKETSQRLFTAANAPARVVQDVAASFLDTIRKVSTPDVTLSAGAREIGFVHRKTSDADIYFLANTSNAKQTVQATFRIEGMKAELWDPFTGTVAAASIEKSDKGTAVTLDLEPYASRVLVFSKRSLPAAELNEAAVGLKMDLSTDWQVSFGSGAAPTRYGTLRSWTDEESTRYFSGAATYTKSAQVSSDLLDSKRKTYLDFGEGEPIAEQPLRSGMQAWFNPPVREAAVVYVNEQRAGSVWCPPFRLDVTGFLHAGANEFRVVVANTAVNYMAGHSLPDYRLLNLRYGERFQAQDMEKVQPTTSGLLGPIHLVSR